ncbi:uncharacterized protein BKCO1_25000111 [Diplodia corticola]|uniref:Uncharacterized protein n=1 Tax=Diplodia corticola TaxID=236234 RepID=A0A1J9S3F3_9PEZI|nr:uncharacterized protein BKCO1_25000111 [Diplodia corticola]OJD34157.1 hypothetical protein BKCO1_25000111 [Diplodia corticola]
MPRRWLQQTDTTAAGWSGSQGWVQYRVDLPDVVNDDAKPVICVNFECPTGFNDNRLWADATASADPKAPASSLFKLTASDFVKRDHPLTGTLTVTFNESLSTRSAVTMVRVARPVTCVSNSRGEKQTGNNRVVWEAGSPTKYEDNGDASCPGSFFPVGFDVTDGSVSAWVLDLTIEVDANLAGVPVTVHGGNDAAAEVAASDGDSAYVFGKTGTQTVRVKVDPPWAQVERRPWGVSGNVAWRLRVCSTGQTLPLNATRLELYALAPQRSLPAYFEGAVPVRLARRAVPRGHTGDHLSWLEYCYDNVFTRFDFRYDATYGAPAYVASHLGGNFRLRAYLAAAGRGASLVNCYDQAAAMQICLALAPGTGRSGVRWAFMDAFGFIKTTELVGWGACNNPFFRNPACARTRECDNDDPRRSHFDNHAFLVLQPSNTVVDATCSPHRGTESPQRYLCAAVQTLDETTLYRQHGLTPGSETNIDSTSPGIVSLDAAAMVPRSGEPLVGGPIEAPPRDRAVARLLQLAAPASLHAPPPKFCNADITAALFDAAAAAAAVPPWDAVRSDVYLGRDATTAEWVLGLRGSEAEVTVQCTVTEDTERASEQMTAHLRAYTGPLRQVFVRPEQRHAQCELSLETAPGLPRPTSLWVFGNVFVRATQSRLGAHDDDDGGDEATAVAHAVSAASGLLYARLESTTVATSAEVLRPRILDVKCPDEVKVGQDFVVRVSANGGPRVDIRTSAANVVLIEANHQVLTYKFTAVEPGPDELHFYFAHPQSLMPASHRHQLTVVE